MPRIPVITKNLLIINILAFIAALVMEQTSGISLNNLLGLHFFMATDFNITQLLTYLFMHSTANWMHITFNMLMLWMFGSVVEQAWGAKRFLFYYILCGIGAGVMQEITQFFWIYYTLYSQHPLGIAEAFTVMSGMAGQLNGLTTVGASGAIYALLLAFGMMFPEERMFIIPIPIPIKAKWMIIGTIALELFLTLATPGDQVAHLAHLGGMLFGFLLIRYWQKHPSSDYGNSAGTQFFNNMRSRWEQRKSTSRSASPNKTNPDWDYNARKEADQEEVDRILDKIRKSGYDSLTKEEKQTLFDQSKK